ncbi:MAG: lipoyl synthase [Candidatus Latescibacteria bacterium]|jgi:lipoyl synthase|nr:lipoyl synthase [Candidatus Latescibacterota bacterium]
MRQNCKNTVFPPKPLWLRQKVHSATEFNSVVKLLKSKRILTVCKEANCPNIGECFSRRTATFLILGENCTRSCRFCAVNHEAPKPPDPDEPSRIAETVRTMGLMYVVITSVTRDDLSDGGAGHFAATISEIRKSTPEARIEVLVPDFRGSEKALLMVVQANPDVINHNIETVKRLYPAVRPEAEYSRSLELLKRARLMDTSILTKSGIMLGMGETQEELRRVFVDILDAGCKILTLGQYLQPSTEHYPVKRYVHPEEFDNLREIALEMGFQKVASGPLVRSSYHADELFQVNTPARSRLLTENEHENK